jgi:hypothetical protein
MYAGSHCEQVTETHTTTKKCIAATIVIAFLSVIAVYVVMALIDADRLYRYFCEKQPKRVTRKPTKKNKMFKKRINLVR